MTTSRSRSIERALAEIDALPTAKLREQWTIVFGTNKTPKLKRELLIAALAYQRQVDRFGGLKRRTRLKLQSLIEGDGNQPTPPKIDPVHLPVGTRLVREYRQRTHVVEVSAEGFVWQGQAFTSLSAIARQITGSHWSGPRFFGLNHQPTDQR